MFENVMKKREAFSRLVTFISKALAAFPKSTFCTRHAGKLDAHGALDIFHTIMVDGVSLLVFILHPAHNAKLDQIVQYFSRKRYSARQSNPHRVLNPWSIVCSGAQPGTRSTD